MKPRKAILGCGLICVLAFAGCWGSKFTLIPPDQAKVDHAYVGDWDALNAKGEPGVLMIRNIDDKEYFVETHDKDGTNVTRYVGFLASVKNASFVELRPIQDDGNIPDSWLIMRIELAENKITLRQLSDDFFKGKTIDSAQALRQTLEQNLDNQQMYAQDETITATKIAK
jgi:hypothetical protein